jgi:hypothetical protein
VTSRPPETRLGIAALAFASSAHPKPKMAVWAPGSPRSLRSGYSRLSLAWVDSEPAAPPAPLLRKPNGVRCGAISNEEIRSWRKHIMSRLRNFTAQPPNRTAKPPLHGKKDDKAGLEHSKKAETQAAEAHKATTAAHGASVAIPAKS